MEITRKCYFLLPSVCNLGIVPECRSSGSALLNCHLICILEIKPEWQSARKVILCCYLVCILSIILESRLPGQAILCCHLVCIFRITPECWSLAIILLFCNLVCIFGVIPEWSSPEIYSLLPCSVYLESNTRMESPGKSLSKGFSAKEECVRLSPYAVICALVASHRNMEFVGET